MSNFNSLIRGVTVAAAVLASAAFAQAPANDVCANATVVTPVLGNTVTTTAVNVSAAATGVEATLSCGGTAQTNSVWYSFTAAASGSHTLSSCTVSNFDTVIQVYTGGCAGLTQVASSCSDDSCGTQSSVTITLVSGTTYWVQIAAYNASKVSATSVAGFNLLSPPPPPPNETCSGAEPIVPNGAAVVVSAPARTSTGTAAVEEPFACLTTPTAANSSVWYSITPTVTGTYRMESCSATAPAANVADTVLGLYTGTCGALTSAGCNNDSCGTRSSITATLTAGVTYYLQLAKNGSTVPTASADTEQLSVTQIINGPADLCSTAPTINLNETIVVSTTAAADGGYSVAQNNAQLDGGACYSGIGNTTSALGVGRDVAYQFRASNAGRYSFRIGTPSASVDAMLYLTDSCVPVTGTNFASYGPPQCIAAGNRNTSTQEQLSCVPIGANQTVFVWVDEVAASTSGSSLSLDVTPCAAESEPNDTPATASTLSCATTGAITTNGEADFFAIGAPPAGTRVFLMAEGAAANSNDFDLRLTTSTGTIEYDDYNLSSAFGDNSPLIAGAISPGGPLYARVNHFSATTTADPYVVYSALQTAAPIPEVEPNQNMATATTGAPLYFMGTIVDGGTDVDVYSFTANAGDIVFAALDSVPDKLDGGGSTFNYAMSLLDSNDATLLRVDDTSTNTVTTGPINNTLTSTTPSFPGEGLVYRIRTTGTYGIRIDKTSGANTNPYLLNISVGCADLQPTLASLTPVSGTPSGGQQVTLSGTNFNERSVVRFGSAIATIVSVTPTQIVVLSPASTSGPVAVSVTNGVGLTASIDPGFTYDDPPGVPPNLVSITPAFGPIDGGTAVTLQGSVFRVDAGVFFDVGGNVVPALNVTVVNASRITATTPAQLEGVANVQVINYDGLVSTLPAGFRFDGPPVVASITPNTGLTTGGLTITLNGRNFRTGTTVRIGGTLATAVTPAADGLSMTAVTPSTTASGAVDVIVRTTDGQDTTVTGGFTYTFPAPTIATISPTQGFARGGTPITITGTSFQAGVSVTISGVAVTNIVRTGTTQITGLTASGTPGLGNVVVTNTDSQSATLAGGFRYVAPPSIASVSPSHGPMQGGTPITISGMDFQPGTVTVVRLGGVPAFAATVTSAMTITAVTNANMAPGPVDIEITNADTQVGTLAAAFTYDATPTMSSLSPSSGTTAGGTVVTITGTGFLPNATVSFGTAASPTVTVVSSTEITAVTPATPVSVVGVTVRNADGQTASIDRSFRFVTPPSLTAATPNSGEVAGGTVVRLTGTGFNTSTTVSFGGAAAMQVSLVSATELDAVTPRHLPGAVDVVVSTEGASATLAGGFTYTRGAPTLTNVAPASGAIAGGTLLTLSGAGFADGATITVGGVAATDVVIVSDVLARAVVPAHAAGLVDVVFTNDDLQASTLTGAFTYVAPANNNGGTVVDGGTGAIGQEPMGGGGGTGGVSCGCSSFDGSMFSMAGFGLLVVLSRRRRRS
ncbi:MAG: IPT/TIG domain-containing protein [Archangium sp.]